ncbi:MAG: sugar ABC transporter substrate-binding protein [Thermoguttaceae bacterium]|nr:sugar ABC transporter substrate-binding protein [Thermoguttaceae bacterium]
MKRTRLTSTLIAACGIALATALAGCQPAEQGRVFGVTFQTMNNPFFVDLNDGIREVVEAHGDRLVTLDAQFNSAKQLKDIADLTGMRNMACIFINPVNWEGITGSLLQARTKGIPCIVVDAPAKDKDLVLSTVASDNVQAGRLAAEALAKVKPKAKVVILHHSVNKACIDRVEGFTEVARKSGMEILETQEGKGRTDEARRVMLDLLGRHKTLDAVFPINDPSALGAISALESTGRLKDVSVVTVDGSQEGIRAILDGKLLSTSAQFPREIGRIAAEKAYDHLAGKPVEKDVVVRVELITRENADAFLKK